MENRKTLNIFAAALAIVLLCVLIVGHVQTNKSQVLELPADAQTLTATADGRNGPVSVEVIASPTEIFKIRVTEHAETDGIGTLAVDALPGNIVEAQSLSVDAVSGASLTSEAIRTAVANALESGGFDPSAFGYTAPEEKPAATPAPALPAAAASGAGYIPGTYEAEANGMGKVKVSVTVDETSITDVVLDTSGETPEIGGAATEKLTEQVLAAQGAEIDGVAGASLTSNAVRTAVADALAQAMAPMDTAEEPAPAAETETAEDGILRASADGRNGPIDVEVTVEGNEIKSVTVTGQAETAGIGSVAVEQIP
ncbi:MAG: FMN-binding protein, partial [Oscillospiraceae bacterium]|nr:FMN-binding protein [Oscillospiraceae bacterium]